jgi:hypothetical protein
MLDSTREKLARFLVWHLLQRRGPAADLLTTIVATALKSEKIFDRLAAQPSPAPAEGQMLRSSLVGSTTTAKMVGRASGDLAGTAWAQPSPPPDPLNLQHFCRSTNGVHPSGHLP